MSDSDSDSGGGKRTPTSRLSEATYGEWKSRMQSRLDSKGIGIYVDGTKICPTKPAGGDAVSEEKAAEKILDWQTKDRQAKALIALQLPADHLHLAAAAKTSKELWDSVLLKYEGNRSGASVAGTITDMMNRRWDGTSSLEKHISWYRASNERLAKFDPGTGPGSASSTPSAALSEHILAIALLNSIPSERDWGAVKAIIYNTAAFKFEEVANRLMGEVARLRLDEKEASRADSAAAHYSRAQSSPTKTSRSAPPTGEWQEVSGRRADKRPTCPECGKAHTASRCWTLHPELMPEHLRQRELQPSRKKGSKDSGKRASRAEQDASDGESAEGWAGCAVLEEDEDEEEGAAAAASASVRAATSRRTEDHVTAHSGGIRGQSLVTDWLVDSGASLHYCRQGWQRL
jgi:hypothetical protein